MRRLLVVALTAGLAVSVASCGSKKATSIRNKPFVVETLINTTKSWNGDFYKYPTGTAQMTLQKITAQPGFKTPLHFHSQPGVAYIVKGDLYCETIDGQALKIITGESLATSQDTLLLQNYRQ